MGYDAMRFALEGVKAVKGDLTDRPALADAISKVTFTGRRGPMSMNPTNNSATQNIYVVRTIKSGSSIGFRLLDTIHSYPDQVTGCALK
jgi:branched-chain amino acid transport system substrate-binding protein